jgi:hypothetical protein
VFNACLTFSWLNKVPFDREASSTIWAGIYMDWQTGAEGSKMGGTKNELKGRLGLISGSRETPWVVRSQFVSRRLPK